MGKADSGRSIRDVGCSSDANVTFSGYGVLVMHGRARGAYMPLQSLSIYGPA